MTRWKRRSDRSGRGPLPSPGRPPAAGRDELRRFWAAIASGLSSEDAAGPALGGDRRKLEGSKEPDRPLWAAISTLWRKLRYQFRPNSLHHFPYFVRDVFEDG